MMVGYLNKQWVLIQSNSYLLIDSNVCIVLRIKQGTRIKGYCTSTRVSILLFASWMCETGILVRVAIQWSKQAQLDKSAIYTSQKQKRQRETVKVTQGVERVNHLSCLLHPNQQLQLDLVVDDSLVCLLSIWSTKDEDTSTRTGSDQLQCTYFYAWMMMRRWEVGEEEEDMKWWKEWSRKKRHDSHKEWHKEWILIHSFISLIMGKDNWREILSHFTIVSDARILFFLQSILSTVMSLFYLTVCSHQIITFLLNSTTCYHFACVPSTHQEKGLDGSR